jgi:hypothetical protein
VDSRRAARFGLVALLWYWPEDWQKEHLREARIFTGGVAPAGYNVKILWAFVAREAKGRGGSEVTVEGRRLDGAGSFRQEFAAISYEGQEGAPSYASIIDVPELGCWRLSLSTGDLRAHVVCARQALSRSAPAGPPPPPPWPCFPQAARGASALASHWSESKHEHSRETQPDRNASQRRREPSSVRGLGGRGRDGLPGTGRRASPRHAGCSLRALGSIPSRTVVSFFPLRVASEERGATERLKTYRRPVAGSFRLTQVMLAVVDRGEGPSWNSPGAIGLQGGVSPRMVARARALSPGLVR